MAHIIPDSSAPSGWQCPACRHVYGPQVSECPRCPETPPAPLFPFPGAVRLPSEYGAIPDLPPRHPMCRTSLVPCPPSREGGMCGCGESDEEHARTRCTDCHMPLTGHHDPMCSQPCGRCEEAKAKEAALARLTLTLPGYMASPGAVQVAGITGAWAEVLPGLEATLRSVRTGHAEVEFRLTPPDGQQHD